MIKIKGTAGSNNGPARRIGPAPRMSATTRASREGSRARNENVRIVKPIAYTR